MIQTNGSYRAIWPDAIPPLDKHDPAFCADPHPTLRYLQEHQPVTYIEHLNAWYVTRAEDLHAALKNPALGHLDYQTPPPAAERRTENGVPASIAAIRQGSSALVRKWIVLHNPPNHTRLHAVLAPHFAARALERPVAAARTAVKTTIAQLPVDQPIDLLAQLLVPVAQAAADSLLGIACGDGLRLRRLANYAVTAEDFDRDPLSLQAAMMAQLQIADSMRTLLQKEPAEDTPGIVPGMRAALAAGEISELEAVGNLMLIAVSAYANISHQLANTIHVLLRHPDQWRSLIERPALAAVALEETLRYEGLATTMLRHVLAETEIGGVAIPRNALVMLSVAAANRDPAVHANPDRLDLTRSPMRHWTFGHGLHFCLGAALTRAVSRVVLEEVAARLAHMTLASPVEFMPSYIKRLPVSLMVTTGGLSSPSDN